MSVLLPLLFVVVIVVKICSEAVGQVATAIAFVCQHYFPLLVVRPYKGPVLCHMRLNPHGMPW